VTHEKMFNYQIDMYLNEISA